MLYDKILGPDYSPTNCSYILHLQLIYLFLHFTSTTYLQCIEFVQEAMKKDYKLLKEYPVTSNHDKQG